MSTESSPRPTVMSVRGFTPKIHESAFVFPNATIIGDVEIGEKSSIWSNVTIRGDVFAVKIGKETNVQDGTVIHGTFKECGTILHDRVTIGHLVMLHGCEIGRGSLIGMGSIVMDKVKIGENCLVGAGSLVTEGSVFPPRSLILGRPARVKRELTAEEVASLEESADNYLLYSSWYKT